MNYWMKPLGLNWHHKFRFSINSLGSKRQLIESFKIQELGKSSVSYAIYFYPPETDSGVIGYICTIPIHRDRHALEELLSSVKEFVDEIPDDHLKDEGDALKELKKKVEDCKQEVNNILDILGKKVIFPGDCDYIK